MLERKAFWACAAVVGLGLAGSGCSSAAQYVLIGTPRAPAADGWAEVDVADRSAAELVLDLRHLPPPTEVQPETTCYVVWARPSVGKPVRLAVLQYNRQTWTSGLTVRAPLRAFTLLVTAEKSPNEPRPSALIVVERSVSVD